ncbi:CaiB/BaiF CoA transferase family protein [Pseudonocardia pini]|uniref:CaiB/BaiF CoA transferase family protein n=1 Tax=Pseudonocardia pini TaxID=2758030 RepID=UPI0015F052A2|nr:CaiB/BaiF CoA-transferase family protein [Pseudonocardia pini]
MGPLEGITVIDLSRLAPGPYGTMLLADLGADVVTVLGGRAGIPALALRRGKREIVLDLKSEAGRAALHGLVRRADVLVEGFRPGAAERMGAGYEELSALNPGLVYCSVTGYGQDGPLAHAPGHDINYLALAGLLGALESPGRVPVPPFNVVGDFAGGGLLAAFGICAALVERQRSGRGQRIDANMVEGTVSLMAMVLRDFGSPVVPRGEKGLMDGAAPFYRCYRCADDRYVSVGAVEDRFFAALWTGLGLPAPVPPHMDPVTWPAMSTTFEEVFATRTRDEWAEALDGTEACVAPVLDPCEARENAHLRARRAFESDGSPAPVPRFSRTPGVAGEDPAVDTTVDVLEEFGVPADVIAAAVAAGSGAAPDGLVTWPPY